MSQKLRSRFCFVIAISICFSSPAWAFKRENRVPLKGANGYFSATGEAKSLEVRHEIKQQDREELIIELKNVPMKPGTTLVVFVGNEEVGKIVLDEKRSGSLKLTSEKKPGSEKQKTIPLITAGSVVSVKTPDGLIVMK